MLGRFGRHVRQQLVGYLALFVALGGVSYAAVTLPKNSVGSRQIKNGQVKNADLGKSSVTGSKVKDGSLLSTDFKLGQLPAGATGPAGPQGPKGDKGDAGTNGTNGSQGPAGTVSSLFAQSSGLVNLPASATTTVLSLNLPAGSFAITARGGVNNNGAATGSSDVTCTLTAGGDTQDLMNLFLGANGSPGETEWGSWALAHTYATAGQAVLSCATSAAWGGGNFLRPAITAVQVSTIN